MRLATFNLLNGASLADRRVEVSRLHEAIATLDADVVGLQEVDRHQPRSHGLDLTAEVARAAGVLDAPGDHWRFVPALVGTPGGSWRGATDADQSRTDTDSASASGTGTGTGTATDAASDTPTHAAHYGIGLVSRWPVKEWQVVRLPAAPMRSPIMLPGTRQVIWLQDEPRVGLAAVVETPAGVMTVATTHLSFVPVWNGVQLRTLTAALAQLPGPRVLLGDLNMPGAVPRWLTRWQVLARTPTYPAWEPKIQLDHVLGHGELPPVVAVETPELPLSDHRALLVELSGH